VGPRAILLIAASVVAAAGGQPPSGPKPGDPYPSYLLPSLRGGDPLSVAHFRGKKVLLLQFASW
jgi:hypothetical protein